MATVNRLIARVLPGVVLRFAQRLRFPHLFLLVLALFVLDLLVPDFVPFLDELLLALITMLLGAWKARKERK